MKKSREDRLHGAPGFGPIVWVASLCPVSCPPGRLVQLHAPVVNDAHESAPGML